MCSNGPNPASNAVCGVCGEVTNPNSAVVATYYERRRQQGEAAVQRIVEQLKRGRIEEACRVYSKFTYHFRNEHKERIQRVVLEYYGEKCQFPFSMIAPHNMVVRARELAKENSSHTRET